MKKFFSLLALCLFSLGYSATTTISTTLTDTHFVSASNSYGDCLVIFAQTGNYYFSYANGGGGGLTIAAPLKDTNGNTFPVNSVSISGICFDQNRNALVVLSTDVNTLTVFLFDHSASAPVQFTKKATITNSSFANITSAPVIKSSAANKFLIMYSCNGNINTGTTASVLSITADTTNDPTVLSLQTLTPDSAYQFNPINFLSFDFDTSGNATAAWSLSIKSKTVFNSADNTIFYTYKPVNGIFGSIFSYFFNPLINNPSLASAFAAFANIKFTKGVGTSGSSSMQSSHGFYAFTNLNIFSTGTSSDSSAWCISFAPITSTVYGLFLNTIPNNNPTLSQPLSGTSIANILFNKTQSNELFWIYMFAAGAIPTITQFYNFNQNSASPAAILSVAGLDPANSNVFNNTVFVTLANNPSYNIYSGYISPSSAFSFFPTITSSSSVIQRNINPISATEAFVFYTTSDNKLIAEQF